MPSESLLSLSSVARGYRAGVPGCAAAVEVLRGVSLDVCPGECVAIEGGAGCGKTTLLLCAAGLLRPDSGTVEWPALAKRTTQAPASVRYVGDRATTYGFLTVRESVAYVTTLRQIDHPGIASPAFDVLDVAGLRDLTGTRVALLSRAERARFLVALALVSSASLLLVDDLTADCDFRAVTDFAAALRRASDAGCGVVWTSRHVDATADGMRHLELVRGHLRPRPVLGHGSDETSGPRVPGHMHAHLQLPQRVAEP